MTAISSSVPPLKVEHLSKEYCSNGRRTLALHDITLQMRRGEILTLVGESGCGKSTLAKCIAGLCSPSAGSIHVNGIAPPNTLLRKADRRLLAEQVSLVFQNPAASCNPRMKILDIVEEPLRIRRVAKAARRDKALCLLQEVGLAAEIAQRYPPELSGGQLQRVAIARALISEPKLLIADEPLSSLDVSVQAQIANLLLRLRDLRSLSMLLIAHDLQMVRHIGDRTGIMHRGRLIELSPTAQLFSAPQQPYTKQLLQAGHFFSSI